MIENNNPEIDVNELMDKIKLEVEKRNEQTAEKSGKFTECFTKNVSNNINFKLLNVQALTNNAEARSQIKTKWPDSLNKFPLNISKKLQQIILKLVNFFFKEQRVVNISLVEAEREFLAITKELIDQIVNLQTKLNDLEVRITNTEKSYKYSRNELSQQQHLLNIFLAEAQKNLPELEPQQIQSLVREQEHLLDAFYVALEARFRGSREEIITRVKSYLSLVTEANIGTESLPILDLGCGRGEWLQLLKESGYVAWGVEINKVMVNECHSRGLKVIESDAIEYLQSLPTASLGAVTGFHLIEHLPFPLLLKLLTEIVRVLKSQGLVLLETPNPQNILVGSNNFYIDPSHLHPLPSPLSKFLLEYVGLDKVEIINQNPYADSYKVSGSQEVVEVFNRYFYGPQDYAAIGYKI